MMFWHSLNGMVTMEIVGADTASTLTRLQESNVTVYDISRTDDLTLQFRISRQQLKVVKQIVRKRGDRFRIIGRQGVYWTGKKLLKRPMLICGLLFLITMALFLPTRIFFVRVEGNASVPGRLILEQAEKCGISFGASRREVRSEKMKNALLEAMPQLQWAGVNTSGCVATITVRERETVQMQVQASGVSSLVAARDGVILSCTATRGNLLCKPGQAVKAGETLISGYTDCGLSIRAVKAEGEIFAVTQRDLFVCAPMDYRGRGEKTAEIKKYSLLIGKKRINFYKDSGNFDDTCVKMYTEEYMMLPGGFLLPIALITEVWTYYEPAEEVSAQNTAQQQVSDFASDYLHGQMIAGQIVTKQENITPTEDVCILEGSYTCKEMIGRVQNEEIIAPDGEFNGTDRQR